MNQAGGVEIRQLRPDDLDRVVAIDSRITGRSRAAFFEKRLAAALADVRGFVATAAVGDGVLTGVAIARLQDGEFGDDRRIATLDVIGVDPESQHGGQGRLLLQRTAAVLRKTGVSLLRTQVGWQETELTRFFAAAGFTLAPRQILERATAGRTWDWRSDSADDDADAAQQMDAGVPDYSGPAGGYAVLDRDRTLVRSLAAADLGAIVRIDAKLTGRDRSGFFAAKLQEVLGETGIRVSLVAEADGQPVGFVMARVDYGEYGRTEPAAVLDVIGVDPAFGQRGVGRALLSQLMLNLDSLRVETLRTTVRWNHFGLLRFLDRAGFAPSQQLLLSKTVA